MKTTISHNRQLTDSCTYTTPNDMVEVAGWVRNLTDEVYYADTIDLSSAQGSILYIVGDPRTYGISLMVRF